MSEITKPERQLGKKTGHAANYGMQAKTHSEACLKEMDIVIPVDQAERMLEGYHSAFDQEVRAWQQRIREELRRSRTLTNPFGFKRTFYGRMDDDTFRQAYAWKPQSTIPVIINNLMKHMYGHARLLNQVHDALYFECEPAHELEVINRVKDQDAWNPTLELRGGSMRIPIEIQRSTTNFKQMEVIFDG